MRLNPRVLAGVGVIAVVGAVVIVGAVVVLTDPCVIPSRCDLPAGDQPLEPLGMCYTSCDPDLDITCGEGFECVSGTCLNPALCMGCGQTCESDADCSGGLPCVEECPSGQGCTGRFICYSVGLCYGVQDVACGEPCTLDRDCEGGVGFRCLDGICGNRYPEVCDGCGISCDTDADCPEFMTCEELESGGHGSVCWNPGLCRNPVPLNPDDLEQPFDQGVPAITIVPTSDALLDPSGSGPVDAEEPSISVVPVCGDGVCESNEACGADCECTDDGMCTLGEMDRGSCRDCSASPGDLCGVPCSGSCEGGLQCTDAGVCWDNGICGGPGGGGGNNGGSGGNDCSACTCKYFGGGFFCTDVCPGAACSP